MNHRSRLVAATLLASLTAAAAPRPADIAFRLRLIDPGASETAAIVDVNNDGKPDIVSSESWYEAPAWAKRPLREINFVRNFVDNFSDLPIDVDGDAWVDIVQFGYFSRNVVWLKNPGRDYEKPWRAMEITAGSTTEFAFLVDLNNDGQARELLPQFNLTTPLTWFELREGAWSKHVVHPLGHGHGIGAGDVNGDGRNDIITPEGWLEAPPDPRSGQPWNFRATDWALHAMPPIWPAPAAGPVPNPGGRKHRFGFMHVIDVNADGRNDIVTTSAHDYGLCWFEQRADLTWQQHAIDNTWSQAHASLLIDLDGDGQRDLITGKRYLAHNGLDPGAREPLGLFWYQYRRDAAGAVEWVRHIIDYGGRMGGGMQIAAHDLDGDGDLDVVSGGKAGLFLAENLTRTGIQGSGDSSSRPETANLAKARPDRRASPTL